MRRTGSLPQVTYKYIYEYTPKTEILIKGTLGIYIFFSSFIKFIMTG